MQLRCTISTGATLFALVLNLYCTTLSQSETSTFFRVYYMLCNSHNSCYVERCVQPDIAIRHQFTLYNYLGESHFFKRLEQKDKKAMRCPFQRWMRLLYNHNKKITKHAVHKNQKRHRGIAAQPYSKSKQPRPSALLPANGATAPEQARLATIQVQLVSDDKLTRTTEKKVPLVTVDDLQTQGGLKHQRNSRSPSPVMINKNLVWLTLVFFISSIKSWLNIQRKLGYVNKQCPANKMLNEVVWWFSEGLMRGSVPPVTIHLPPLSGTREASGTSKALRARDWGIVERYSEHG